MKLRQAKKIYGCAIAVLFAGIVLTVPGVASEADDAYTRVIAQRADRILEPMGIDDAAKYERVQGVIMQFYRDLSRMQDALDEAGKAIDAVEGLSDEAEDAAVQALRSAVQKELYELNFSFTGSLAAELTPEQVVAVKDGITYGVVPLTYGVYLEMLPDLTAEQKHFILAQLSIAREHALLAGSSHGRHREFGRAKGRINNMLSAAGIDMKQAEADMKARAAKK